jgi:hypothetical protein
VEDDARAGCEAGAVEDRQRHPRLDGGPEQGDRGGDVPGADDRPAAGPPCFRGALLGDRRRRAGGEAGGAEATVAVEVDQRLPQRRERRAPPGGDVDMALEVDRGEMPARQRLRLEATVGPQHDVVDFDQGLVARRGGGPERGDRQRQDDDPG